MPANMPNDSDDLNVLLPNVPTGHRDGELLAVFHHAEETLPLQAQSFAWHESAVLEQPDVDVKGVFDELRNAQIRSTWVLFHSVQQIGGLHSHRRSCRGYLQSPSPDPRTYYGQSST